MVVKHLMIDGLIRVASAGGGLRLDVRAHDVADLVRIASAASSKQALVILENSAALELHDMIRIASAGSGCIHFD